MGDKEKYKFPLTFPCPNCGSFDTISRLLFPNKPQFVYMRREAKPLQDPRTAILTIRMFVRYYDQCANCGMECCTRVEIQNAPITAVPKDQVLGQGPFFKG